MLYGIGVDIVETARIDKVYKKYGDAFAKKILTIKEQHAFHQLANGHVKFLAKRFAAKEAFVKALGIGFSKNLYPKDIGTYNNKNTKPCFHFTAEIENILKSKNIENVQVSISDEKNYAIAFVSMEKSL